MRQEKVAPFSLRALFDTIKKTISKSANGEKNRKPKSELSNAQYHLTPRQMDRIIRAGRNPRDRTMLQLFAETGLRRSEAVNLCIEDVNWGESLLVIRHGKGGKMRLVPITGSLLANMRLFIGSRMNGPVFQSVKSRGLSLRQINRIVAAAGERAKVKNPNPKYDYITPHLFRHSFARLWKDRGGDIEALSKILGHTSVKTTWDLYGKISLEGIRHNYQKVMSKKNSPYGKEA
jgi:integrase/recombinase XerD